MSTRHSVPRPNAVRIIVLPAGMHEVLHVCRRLVSDLKNAPVKTIAVPAAGVAVCGICGAVWKRGR